MKTLQMTAQWTIITVVIAIIGYVVSYRWKIVGSSLNDGDQIEKDQIHVNKK